MKDLTRGSIYKTFILFAIPMVLSGILSQAYGLINGAIAGRYLGSDGLAATGATSALLNLVEAMIWGYGMGFSIYIAKLFGAKEYKKIKSAIYTNTILLFIVTATVGIILIASYGFIAEWLKIDEAIRHDSFIYFSIISAGLFMILFNVNTNFIMNALGISGFPFYMSLLSGILNVVGNIFTVTVLDIGVAGIALATIFSALVVTICYFFKLRCCFSEMGVQNEKVKIGLLEAKEALIYSVPTMTQQLVMSLASFVISPLINSIGASATAAYTIVTRVYNLSASVFQNSSKSLSNFTAQCVGAKKFYKVKQGVRVGLIQGVLFMLPFLILSIVFAKEFCGAFLPKGYEGETLDFAVLFSRYYMPFVFFALINNLFHSFFRGVKAMRFLVISTALGALVRILATIVFVKFYAMEGVYIGWVISWILEAAFAVLVYASGKWKPEEMKNI